MSQITLYEAEPLPYPAVIENLRELPENAIVFDSSLAKETYRASRNGKFSEKGYQKWLKNILIPMATILGIPVYRQQGYRLVCMNCREEEDGRRV